MKNEARILQLIEEMRTDPEYWSDDEDEDFEEINLEGKYGQRVQELGAKNFISLLFPHYQNKTKVINLMTNFFFIWRDFDYQDWRDILYCLAVNKVDLYYFIWFCIKVLEIDIKQIIREDKELCKIATRYLHQSFTTIQIVKTSEPGSPWTQEMFRENGMEAIDYWRKLKSQGAPMRIDI